MELIQYCLDFRQLLLLSESGCSVARSDEDSLDPHEHFDSLHGRGHSPVCEWMRSAHHTTSQNLVVIFGTGDPWGGLCFRYFPASNGEMVFQPWPLRFKAIFESAHRRTHARYNSGRIGPEQRFEYDWSLPRWVLKVKCGGDELQKDAGTRSSAA